MQKILSMLLVGGLVTGASTARAAAPNMQPGLWEITSTMEMPGMPMQMPPSSIKQCFTKSEMTDASQVLPKDDKCDIGNLKVEGNKTSWTMQCKGEPAMNGNGSVIFSGSSYAGSVNMTIKNGKDTMQMTQKYTARRVGDCSK